MKYYSEKLNKLYDTEDALQAAEAKAVAVEEKQKRLEQQKKEARATRAKEVDEAIKSANEAQAKAVELLKAFTKDYGYFHTSYHVEEDEGENPLTNLFFSLF